MDDRFDRRELLLHLGDVLEAASDVAKLDQPDVPVSHLAANHSALQAFQFLRHVAASVLAKDFPKRVATAYADWPRALLEAELDREALASPVRRELFADGSPGWAEYVGYMREKVDWFGADLSDAGTANVETTDSETPAAAQEPTHHSPAAKKGWPWTPVG